MKFRTTGRSCHPGGRYSARRRTAARQLSLALCTVIAVLAVARSSGAQDQALFCGAPQAHQLAAGATDRYVVSLRAGTRVSADVIPTSNLGLLRTRGTNFSPPDETCRSGLVLTSPSGPGIITVADCLASAARGYTITLSVVSPGPDSCAVALPCGTSVSGTGFETLGEVDSYSFAGVEGEEAGIAITGSTVGQVRLRLFDPTGVLIYDDEEEGTCAGSFRAQLPRTGTYTVLVSSCDVLATGQYTITRQSPSCAAKALAGQFAYVVNADSGTMSVIELTTLTPKAIIPIAAPGQAAVAVTSNLTITPNGGFAYATYAAASVASVINTTTNLISSSVPVGLEAAGVAIHPDGSTAYILSNSLQGIAIVDTRTRKITGVGARDIQFSQGLQAATTPDGVFLFTVSEDLGALLKINTTDYMTEGVASLDDLGIFDAFRVSPDGTFAYAGVLDGILVLDTAIMMPITTIAVGEPFAIAFTPDGRTAYASIADEGTVAVIDTSRHAVTTTIPVGENPGGVAVLPSGLVYVTDFTSAATEPGLYVIDAATNKVVASTPTLGDGPTNVALTTAPPGLCAGDSQGETQVTVDELVLSVNYLLNGCPGRFPMMSILVP